MNIPRLIWEKARFLTQARHCFSVIRQLPIAKSGKNFWSLRVFIKQHIDAFYDSIAGMQTLGASGACHMGATFLKKHYWPNGKQQTRTVYMPAETWGMFQRSYSLIGFGIDLT